MSSQIEGAVLVRVVDVMRQTFVVPAGTVVTRATSSADIDGWDSLSHALFILGLEDAFGIELPLEKTTEARDVGELIDLLIAGGAGAT
jgi:acyl carrier protein